jgi:lysophospholipase
MLRFNSLTLMIFLYSIGGFAISESKYIEDYNQKVKPFFLNNFVSNTYPVKNNIDIHYFSYNRNSNKALVVLPGQGELAEKYKEIAYDLKDLGHDMYFWTPRGQGLSGSDVDNKRMQHLDSYKDWVSDLEIFMDLIKSKYNYEEIHLIAHSMGAGIGMSYMQSHPKVISKAFINAPMIEIDTYPYPRWLAKAIAAFQVKRGKAKEYIFGADGQFESPPFEENKLTQSKARYEEYMKILKENHENRVADVSFGWFYESLKLGNVVNKNWKKLSPVEIIFTEPGRDLFSGFKRLNRICSKLDNCSLVKLPNSKHEAFVEIDEIRDQVITKMKELFK